MAQGLALTLLRLEMLIGVMQKGFVSITKGIPIDDILKLEDVQYQKH